MMDFADALDTGATEFEPSKLLPIGTYTWSVTKPPENKVVGKDKDWDRLTFMVKCISAEDDVDPDDLSEYGSVKGDPSRVSFLFPKDADKQNDWNKTRETLDKFLFKTLQVDVDEDATLKQALAASVNCHFLGVVKHVPDSRTEGDFQSEIGSTAPVS